MPEVRRISRERAAALLAGHDRELAEGGTYSAMMLKMVDDGLIEPGEDAAGALKWRPTPKGLALHDALTAMEKT